MGLSVCYDLRFPELFRQQLEAGMEIMVLPSAFTAITGRAHWEVLVRARTRVVFISTGVRHMGTA